MTETQKFLAIERALIREITPAYAAHWHAVHAEAAARAAPIGPPVADRPDWSSSGPTRVRVRDAQILAAAAGLAQPGGVVSPTAIHRATEIPMGTVYKAVRDLRSRGLWPYAMPPRGPSDGAEETAGRESARVDV